MKKTTSRALCAVLLLSGAAISTGCSTPPESPGSVVPTSVACPPVPGDLAAETRARTRVKRGPKTSAEITSAMGDLALSEERKNRALRRALKLYGQCRKA